MIEGKLSAQQFIALFVKDGQLVAALACEREATTARLIEAMRAPLSQADAVRLIGEKQ